MSNVDKFRTAYALGINNIFFATLHRIKVRFGLLKYAAPKSFKPSKGGVYFLPVMDALNTSVRPSDNWQETALYFGWFKRDLSQDKPPDWFDFKGISALPVDDIKLVWEASRFGWLFPFVQRVLKGDQCALRKINSWIEDWVDKNPPYVGSNWMCGQEVAIRVLHLAISALMLKQIESVQFVLAQLIELHLHRIELTLRYAIAQDNNHGVSEAAALFVGGNWLSLTHASPHAKKWENLGRRWLNNRILRLVALDGSISQYSINYHRMIIDTCSMVELWCKKTHNPSAFSDKSRHRISNAIEWLASMTDPICGDAPYVGAYDGSRLIPITDGERDFRTSVQLSGSLFDNRIFYTSNGTWQDVFLWLDLPIPKERKIINNNYVFDCSGFVTISRSNIKVLMRYPRFDFRPSQSDILHVDFWVGERNHLRDAGTYSYAATEDIDRYFSGTHGHNTIQFDGRDQMPRLGPFLFGNWLKTYRLEPLMNDDKQTSFAASYRDAKGVYHKRNIILYADKLKVIDDVRGFRQSAVIRWRLLPGNWDLDDGILFSEYGKLTVSANMPILRMEVVFGWESRYYLQKTPVPVLEVEVEQPGLLTSEYEWIPNIISFDDRR